jgi:short-subunit dehydrogenase
VRLQDRVALVTGAASGIGRALCLALAREGAAVALLDRNEVGLKSLAVQLDAAGARCAHAVADVRDRRQTHEAIHNLADRLGPVDLLVACAGITGVTLVNDLALDDMENMVRVNLLGVAHALDAVLPNMLARRSGQVVAISSLAGLRGMPFSASYSATKAALTTYLESLRPALRKRGIVVGTIFPGFVRTPLMESAKGQPPMAMMEPEEAARHILKAIVQRRRIYSFPWKTRLLVAAVRWLPPWLFDWVMSRAARNIPNLEY